jgi:hypothetical protein
MPLYLVSRAGTRPHEEHLVAELVNDMMERGLPPEAWGQFTPTAIAHAHKYGLGILSKALGSKEKDPPPLGLLTVEDQFASAFVWEDKPTIALMRGNGVKLRGRSIVESGIHGRVTLSQKWVSEKKLCEFRPISNRSRRLDQTTPKSVSCNHRPGIGQVANRKGR